MKRLLFISIVITLILLVCSCDSGKDSIKVMTLNLRYDNPDDSANAWSKRISIVSKFLKDQNPDLLGMQEVLYHQYEQLDSVLKEYSSIGVGRGDGAKAGGRNPAFSRQERVTRDTQKHGRRS